MAEPLMWATRLRLRAAAGSALAVLAALAIVHCAAPAGDGAVPQGWRRFPLGAAGSFLGPPDLALLDAGRPIDSIGVEYDNAQFYVLFAYGRFYDAPDLAAARSVESLTIERNSAALAQFGGSEALDAPLGERPRLVLTFEDPSSRGPVRVIFEVWLKAGASPTEARAIATSLRLSKG